MGQGSGLCQARVPRGLGVGTQVLVPAKLPARCEGEPSLCSGSVRMKVISTPPALQCFHFQRALKTVIILFEPQNRPWGSQGMFHVFFALCVLGKA